MNPADEEKAAYAEAFLPRCPHCGGGIPNNDTPGEYPGALSRWDDETEVCSACGVDEAVRQWNAESRMLRSAGIALVVHPVKGEVKWVSPPQTDVGPITDEGDMLGRPAEWDLSGRRLVCQNRIAGLVPGPERRVIDSPKVCMDDWWEAGKPADALIERINCGRYDLLCEVRVTCNGKGIGFYVDEFEEGMFETVIGIRATDGEPWTVLCEDCDGWLGEVYGQAVTTHGQ